MKCPFCAEEIRDDAIVCRHCQRDFSPLRVLLDRVRKLEVERDELRTVIAHLKSSGSQRSGLSKRAPQTSEVTFRIVLAIFFVLYVGVAVAAMTVPDVFPGFLRNDSAAITVLIAMPMLFGFVAELFVETLRWRPLFTTAASAAAAVEIVRATIDHNTPFAGWFGLAMVLGTCLSMFSAAVAGRWLRSRRDQPRRMFLQPLAKALVSGEEHPGSDLRVERLSKLLTALAALLTSLVGILGAVLTFLAKTRSSTS